MTCPECNSVLVESIAQYQTWRCMHERCPLTFLELFPKDIDNKAEMIFRDPILLKELQKDMD